MTSRYSLLGSTVVCGLVVLTTQAAAQTIVGNPISGEGLPSPDR